MATPTLRTCSTWCYGSGACDSSFQIVTSQMQEMGVYLAWNDEPTQSNLTILRPKQHKLGILKAASHATKSALKLWSAVVWVGRYGVRPQRRQCLSVWEADLRRMGAPTAQSHWAKELRCVRKERGGKPVFRGEDGRLLAEGT